MLAQAPRELVERGVEVGSRLEDSLFGEDRRVTGKIPPSPLAGAWVEAFGSQIQDAGLRARRFRLPGAAPHGLNHHGLCGGSKETRRPLSGFRWSYYSQTP